jgi:hypothetical protein
MKLRKWQADCINLAFEQYQSGNSHFLALENSGSGLEFCTKFKT